MTDPITPEDADRMLTRGAVKVFQKVIHRERLGASVRSSMQFRTEVDHWPEQVAGGLIHQLEAFCMADHLVADDHVALMHAEAVLDVPATWWDHFKTEQVEATSPLWRWVARRWPPKTVQHVLVASQTQTITFAAKRFFPQADWVASDDFGKPIIVESYSVDRGPKTVTLDGQTVPRRRSR